MKVRELRQQSRRYMLVRRLEESVLRFSSPSFLLVVDSTVFCGRSPTEHNILPSQDDFQCFYHRCNFTSGARQHVVHNCKKAVQHKVVRASSLESRCVRCVKKEEQPKYGSALRLRVLKNADLSETELVSKGKRTPMNAVARQTELCCHSKMKPIPTACPL